jgi:hypothetical protein
MRRLIVCILLTLFAWPASGQGLQFLDCPQVSFETPGCLPIQEESAPPPREAPPTEPLFTRENMAPDTPTLMLKLLQEPSVENARKYLDWSAERIARMRDVQQLLTLMTPKGAQHGAPSSPR